MTLIYFEKSIWNRNFLNACCHVLFSNLICNEWILKIIRHYDVRTFEWIVNNVKMNRFRHVAKFEYVISEHEIQLIDFITKFDSKQKINAYFNKLYQKRNEFIEQYHVRVIHFFVLIDDVNRQSDITLSELNEKYHFQKIIEIFFVNLKNKQFNEQLLSIYHDENLHIFNLTKFCVIASIKYAFIQHERKFLQKKNINWFCNNNFKILLIVKLFEFRNFTSFCIFWSKYDLKYRKSVQLWISRITKFSQKLLFQNMSNELSFLQICKNCHSKFVLLTNFRSFWKKCHAICRKSMQLWWISMISKKSMKFLLLNLTNELSSLQKKRFLIILIHLTRFRKIRSHSISNQFRIFHLTEIVFSLYLSILTYFRFLFVFLFRLSLSSFRMSFLFLMSFLLKFRIRIFMKKNNRFVFVIISFLLLLLWKISMRSCWSLTWSISLWILFECHIWILLWIWFSSRNIKNYRK